MKYLTRSVLAAGLVLFLTASSPAESKPLVLFDDGHAQRAGNADWVINGGFSDFADVFKAQGCEVRAISKINASDLAQAKVLVLPEPNSVYTPEEEKLIVEFVNNGGHLYAIADHDRSDRNGDGIDSVGVLNRFLPKLGLEINKLYFSEAPVTGAVQDTPFTKGVKNVGTWGGTSVRLLSPNAVAHICVSAKNGGGAYIASNIVGKGGKVIAMGDSSPYDDGTGDPRDKLHNGFSNPKFNHDILARNTVAWLLSGDRAAPVARVRAMVEELEAGQAALTTQPSEALFQFVENTEGTLRQMIRQAPALSRELTDKAAGSPALNNLARELADVERFRKAHDGN